MTMVEEDAYVLASRIYQSRLTNPAELDKVLADYFNRNNWTTNVAFYWHRPLPMRVQRS